MLPADMIGRCPCWSCEEIKLDMRADYIASFKGLDNQVELPQSAVQCSNSQSLTHQRRHVPQKASGCWDFKDEYQQMMLHPEKIKNCYSSQPRRRVPHETTLSLLVSKEGSGEFQTNTCTGLD